MIIVKDAKATPTSNGLGFMSKGVTVQSSGDTVAQPTLAAIEIATEIRNKLFIYTGEWPTISTNELVTKFTEAELEEMDNQLFYTPEALHTDKNKVEFK